MKRLSGLMIFAALALAGCQPPVGAEAKTESAGGHGHDHGEETETFFEEGKGIRLPEESQEALDLKIGDVAETKIQDFIPLTAQVYRIAREPSRSGGGERTARAYALALLPVNEADKLKPGQRIEFHPRSDAAREITGTVWKLNRQLVDISGRVEGLIEIPDAGHALAMGEFLDGRIPAADRMAVSVPVTSVLQTAQGAFVFVENGKHLLRTAVQTGAVSGDRIEITDGLYEGDRIAIHSVENLYLIELRATKGGGHSH